jgi:hypothetical protein
LTRRAGRVVEGVAHGVGRAFGRVQDLVETHATAVAVAAVATTGIAAVILRLFAIGRLGINSDEAVYSGQAATLAGVEGFAEDFSIFRAHPLLYQYTVSVVYRAFGFHEVSARLVTAVFGLATVFVVYLIGQRLSGRRTGLVAAGIFAVMPFHVIVSRQALLETPMTFFYALTLYALLRYFDALDGDGSRVAPWAWAFTTGAMAGLAFMAKEVAGILLVVIFGAMLVGKRFRITHSIPVLGAFVVAVSPHLLALRLGPKSEGGGGWAEYLIWQLARPTNHPLGFYPSNVFVYFGLPFLLLIVIGLWWSIRDARRNPALVALLFSVIVPVWFFQVWKVKGWHYPVVIAPAVAVLAAWVLNRWWDSIDRRIRGFATVAAVATLASLIGISAINGPIVENYRRIGEAGYSGIPGGREAAVWLADNAPDGSRIIGIGPSIGNIIRWYSDHTASAISISPNPLRANPAYEPVRNPDYELRWGLVEYLVYDAYSAARTPHFANRLLDFVERYGADIVHEQYGVLVAADGHTYEAPVIRIYRVGPVGIDIDAGGGESE